MRAATIQTRKKRKKKQWIIHRHTEKTGKGIKEKQQQQHNNNNKKWQQQSKIVYCVHIVCPQQCSTRY